jgi:hypothetical protein
VEKKLEFFPALLLNDLRKNLFGEIANLVENPFKVISLKRRTEVSAFLVSSERFAPLFRALDMLQEPQATRESVAWLLVERWLHQAPAHLREPQLRELADLGEASLKELLFVDPTRANLEGLERLGMDRTRAQRLLKRQEIARAIAAAEAEGLYDAIEHNSSEAI